jgi:hypothetical protein
VEAEAFGRIARMSPFGHDERAAPRKAGLTRWKEHDAYQKALDRLLRDLRVEKA